MIKSKNYHSDCVIERAYVPALDTSLTKKFNLRVHNGILQQIVPEYEKLNAAVVINAENLSVLPSGVDAQVHLRYPGQSQKETLETGLSAAISGGIGAVLTMANTLPCLDNPAILKQTIVDFLVAEKTFGVKILASGCISMGLKGQKATDFYGLLQAGAVALTDDGIGVESDALMEKVFAFSAETGTQILQHAEMPHHGNVLAGGPVQEKFGLKPYTAEMEFQMVERDLRILQNYPAARYHVLHVSSRRTVELVKEAKDKGLKVTCEVSPHHLFFSSLDIDQENTSFKMNPPLRDIADKQALLKALQSGDIDFVATDHAPHEKTSKGKDFVKATFGTVGLETFLPVLATLYKNGELSLTRMIEVFSQKPSEFLGLEKTFGKIEVGREFHAVLVDLNYLSPPWQDKDFHSKSKNSCFVGQRLYGRVQKFFAKEKSYEIIYE